MRNSRVVRRQSLLLRLHLSTTFPASPFSVFDLFCKPLEGWSGDVVYDRGIVVG